MTSTPPSLETATLALQQQVAELQQRVAELQMLATVADKSPDGVFILGPDQAITYANTAYRAMIGHGDSTLGLPLAAVLAPEGAEAMQTFLPEVLANGTGDRLVSYRRRDGTVFICHQTSFVIYGEGQRPNIVTSVRDITEYLRQEEEQKTLKEQVIAAQQATLRELSTPLIPLAQGVLVMPLIGAIDSQRAQQVIEELLHGASERKARVVIVDITGVSVVDTQVANALIRAAQAVKLLGADVVLTGIRPEIAQTLVGLGVDLSVITTRSSLESGIAQVFGKLN
ncbi:MAG TPA: STAS domain-containing protein [Herpetosiphonaceae bacterium]|nr:STAS domain-containing protein [Herpetosiphonaceae bacterium]